MKTKSERCFSLSLANLFRNNILKINFLKKIYNIKLDDKLLMNSRMKRKLINHFYNNLKSLFILGGFFLAIIFSVIRYIAGPEYDFSFFYFLPITLISW